LWLDLQVANYMDERLTAHYVDHCFHRELKKFAEESIQLPEMAIPDNVAILELFGTFLLTNVPMAATFVCSLIMELPAEKPVSGLISLLDETCQFPRGDDKAFADKTISTHVKTKLVRSGGSKAKQATAFVVRHYFAEVTYDSAGFVQTSRIKLPANALNLLSTSPLPVLNPQQTPTAPNRFGSTDIMDKLTTRTVPAGSSSSSGADAPAAVTPSSVSAKLAGAGGQAVSKQTSFPFSKCRDNFNKLLKAIDETSTCTYVLCLRPHLDSSSRAMNPEYVAKYDFYWIYAQLCHQI
jgi:myosin heavy subunit